MWHWRDVGPSRPIHCSKNEFLASHRGPDGNDVWSDSHFTGPHPRLAILDIEGSAQLLFGPHNEVLIVNGEIYNFRQLRNAKPMYPWTTKGDSEVLLSLFHSAKAKVKGQLSA